MDGGVGIVGAAGPNLTSVGAGAALKRKPPVRHTRYPEAIRAEAELAALLDQDEDDLALHERGQRALGAAKDLARASTRAEENRALAAHSGTGGRSVAGPKKQAGTTARDLHCIEWLAAVSGPMRSLRCGCSHADQGAAGTRRTPARKSGEAREKATRCALRACPQSTERNSASVGLLATDRNGGQRWVSP